MPSDSELLARYRGGDPRAMDALVDRHGPAVYAFIRRTLGETSAAEDITQEVWLRVIRHADRFDERARFSTWLFAVTRNACMDHLRRKRRQPPQAPDDGAEPDFRLDDLALRAPAVVDRLAQRELSALVEGAVQGLPDAQRDVFLLREQTDLSFTEIADLLGVPRETVKSRMRYALAFIRRAVRTRLGQEAGAHGL